MTTRPSNDPASQMSGLVHKTSAAIPRTSTIVSKILKTSTIIPKTSMTSGLVPRNSYTSGLVPKTSITSGMGFIRTNHHRSVDYLSDHGSAKFKQPNKNRKSVANHLASRYLRFSSGFVAADNTREISRSFLKGLYERMNLNEKQKKDFHVMLVKLRNFKDVGALADEAYREIKDRLCCNDERCLCGSRMSRFGAVDIKGDIAYKDKLYYDQLFKKFNNNCKKTLDKLAFWEGEIDNFKERAKSMEQYHGDEGKSDMENLLTEKDFLTNTARGLYMQIRTLT